MRRIFWPLCVFLVLAGSSSVEAQLVDDFSGDLSNWTSTRILDAQNAGTNTAAFAINGSGQLELDTTAYNGIEQYAFIYGGLSLAVGEEIVVDVPIPLLGDRNLGLYVGGTAPVVGDFDGVANAPVDTRFDYITCYSGTNDNIAARGFDGGTEYSNTEADAGGAQSMFIAQTVANTFDVGFYDVDGVRTVFETRTPEFANAATFVGIYADVRVAGIVGTADNFRIQTIPSDVLLGDVNLDGSVNFLDISAFIAALSGGVFQLEADTNGDGAVNFLDISEFIALLN